MAYTNVWSNIIPAGSDAANTADNQLRQLRSDLNERFDDFLAEDWTADPIVLKNPLATINRARVYRNAALTLNTGAGYTAVIYDTETYDVGSMWAGGAPTRLTTVTDGYHRISANLILIAGAAASICDMHIKKNGTDVIAGTFEEYAIGDYRGMYISIEDDATADDYYEVLERQQSGNSDYTHYVASDPEAYNFFQITWMFA